MSSVANTGYPANEIGDVIIIQSKIPVDGVLSLQSFVDDIENESAERYFTKEFRYSTNQGATYTSWTTLNNTNLEGLEFQASEGILFDYRYTRAGTDATEELFFKSVDLVGEFRDSFMAALGTMDEKLYPQGRAFKIPIGGIRDKVRRALLKSEDRFLADANSLLYSFLPDNDLFSEEDADIWEKRLAVPNGSALSLAVRKENILRKYSYPGPTKARSNWLFIQTQLQAAGFEVYIHENRFPTGGGVYEPRSYVSVAGIDGFAIHSPLVTHGQTTHGQGSAEMVANSLEAEVDNSFNLNGDLSRTFFVGGSTVGSTANVPASREKEFRQMLLTYKPLNTVAFLLINYT